MSDLLERVITREPTPRVKRLRESYLQMTKRPEPVYTIFSDRAITRVMKETEGESIYLRRAKAFAAVVREMPKRIPDELFVAGWPDPVVRLRGTEGRRTEIELDCFRYPGGG